MSKHEKFHFNSASELQAKAIELGIDLPWSDSVEPLLLPATIRGIKVPNRLVVQPMEGFDSDENGTPGELAFRRYGRYAAGGNGMIWFEACSVVPDGRSNSHQMMISSDNVHQYKALTDHIRKTAAENFGNNHRPFVVLQLTHSGRYAKPNADFQSKIFSDNPFVLAGLSAGHQSGLSASLQPGQQPTTGNLLPDPPHPPTPSPALASLTGEGERSGETSSQKPYFYSDSEIDQIKAAYIKGIDLAEQAGFDAVDIKACHGYLLHEMLFAYDRTDSRYGGSYENRTSFLREVLNAPSRIIKALRLSAFDMIPHPYGFGMASDGSFGIDLTETKKLIAEFSQLVPLWNISAGIPRHNAHVGRPFDRGVFNAPPPDEFPLIGVARLINITGELQQTFPDLHFVGSGYSWLRQFYPYVGAGVIDRKEVSFIGLGRSSFAYPDAPKDLMEKGKLDPKKVCVSCSKCTEFMRQGVPTGCAVRDKFYSKKGQRDKNLLI